MKIKFWRTKRPESGFWIAQNWPKIGKVTLTSQLTDMASSSVFSCFRVFFLFGLVTGPTLIPISLLVLELWQFSFLRDWPEIRISEIRSSEFYPISGDCGELGKLNLACMNAELHYWILKSVRVTAYTVFELLRKNKQRVN